MGITRGVIKLDEEEDSRVQPREVVSVGQDGSGYTVELSCGHILWSAIEFHYSIVCAQCVNEFLDEKKEKG